MVSRRLVRVAKAERVPPKGGLFVELVDEAREFAVFRAGGGFVVVDNTCPHMGGNLAAGFLDEQGAVHCPLHDWTFDSATGRCRTNESWVRTYPAEVHDGWVCILLEP